jgi:hypothetical protein
MYVTTSNFSFLNSRTLYTRIRILRWFFIQDSELKLPDLQHSFYQQNFFAANVESGIYVRTLKLLAELLESPIYELDLKSVRNDRNTFTDKLRK